MQELWHIGHKAFLGALLIAIIRAPLALGSVQPSNPNSPAPNTQAGMYMGPSVDFMSKAWTNSRPHITPAFPRTKEEIDGFNAMKKRAEQGDADVQSALGAEYWAANDYSEALKWFRKAAAQNQDSAQYALGLMYQNGRGVGRDEKEAMRWFHKAAGNGHAASQFELGACYYEGSGVLKNKVEAYKWFDLADCFGFGAIYSGLGISVTNDAASMRAKVAQEMTREQVQEAERAFARVLSEIPDEARWTAGFSLCHAALSHLDKKEYPKAVEWLRKGAKLGYGAAEGRLGQMYLSGEGVERDYAEAFRLLHKAAGHGDERALKLLGMCYENGTGVQKDYTEAAKWWRKAAEQGSATAQFNLGVCYDHGQGVEKNQAEAAKWYRKAAEQGDADAQCNLGICYDTGQGVGKDYPEAVKWFRKAADQGNAHAQYSLGVCYAKRQGVEKDYPEAVKWWRKAAEHGNADAQSSLGGCYYRGQGIEKDYAAAAKWYRKAAEQGDADAQCNLGVCYDHGQGVEQDQAEAVKWFRKAAEHGDADAQSGLGGCYYRGQGVEGDFQQADKWYRKAAEQGSLEAQCGLGTMYYLRALVSDGAAKGTSHPPATDTTKDYLEAAKWFRQAAEKGHPGAQAGLGGILLNGRGVAVDHAEALKWLRRSANQGNALGQSSLGECYEEGKGVPQDFLEAYKWYNLAGAESSHSASQRQALTSRMTPEQIAEAQRRSARFVASKEAQDTAQAPQQTGTSLDHLERQAGGSGFFVTEDGCLVTSFHVVAGAARIVIRTGKGTLSAKLINADKVNDVAVLKVNGKFPALPVAPSRATKLGETVFTIGFPNLGLQGFAPKLSKGEISTLTGAQDDPREFQISVAVQPGNSGGPLVNQYGNVVGVVEARLADIATLKSAGSLPQNVNYALKSSVLSVLLESLPEVSSKLKEPYPPKDRKFEDVVRETESATALVLVY